MNTQLDLRLTAPRQEVDHEAIKKLPTLTAAVVLCAAVSGIPDKTICHTLDLQPSVWTRVKQGECSLSGEQMNELMDLCGNEVPLLWLVNRRGYDVASLRQLETELQRENRELRGLLEQAMREQEVVKRWMKETRA